MGRLDEVASLWPALLDLAAGRAPQLDNCAAAPLWSLYAPIAQGQAKPAFVVAQLGQSLDGRVATATGKSRDISCPQGIAHLHRLRALVDAVVIGVGTVVSDDPQLNVRKVDGPSPARVVIDPNFRMPGDARLLTAPATPLFAVQATQGARPEGVTPLIVPARDGRMDPADIVKALAALGFGRILVEGGARTVSAFLAARAVDRLHLTISPILIGSGPVGVNLPAIDELDGALRPSATIHRIGEDVLFDCEFP